MLLYLGCVRGSFRPKHARPALVLLPQLDPLERAGQSLGGAAQPPTPLAYDDGIGGLEAPPAPGHLSGMKRNPPLLDMTADGRFQDRSRVTGIPFSMKLMIGAGVVALLAGAAAIAAVALWLISLILPVMIIAACVAWATMRYRRWRSGSFGSQRNLHTL